MALTPDQVPDVATRVLAMREREQRRLTKISEYMRGRHDSVYVPHGAREEYKWLLNRSVVNFLPLVVSVISQNLHVDGYLPTHTEEAEGEPLDAGSAAVVTDPANPWAIWHANRMQARQHALHRAVAKYGIAYNVVLPGTMHDDNGDDIPLAVIRPVSPRRLTALYADDVDDEWPVYAVEERIIRSEKGALRKVWLYDDECRYTLIGKTTEPTLYWPSQGMSLGLNAMGWQGVPSDETEIEEHGLGVCPVVRFLHDLDLDGELDVSGEAEPLIPLQDQVNTSTFNILMAQQYGAFRQRWVTGMVPDDEDGRPKEPFRAGVDRLWVAEDTDTKFGEFGQTDVGGMLNSREASIRHMSTIGQVPPYHLLGQVANLPLALDTAVPVPAGWSTMGDLEPGGKVFAPDGTPVTVKSVSPVFHGHDCYRLTFGDGTQVVADAGHRWETWHYVRPGARGKAVVTTREIAASVLDGFNHYIAAAAVPPGYAQARLPGRFIASCDPVQSVPVRCITVDSEAHQFCVTRSFVRTMNSAEALAAAKDGLDRHVDELEGVLSEPHKQTLRLAGKAAGNKAAWLDRTSTIVWRDTSARAFAATVDALGKLAQMLGVPATELWSRIPGVPAEEVARWKQVAASQGALAELNAMIEQQMTRGAQETPPTEAEPFQGPALRRQQGV